MVQILANGVITGAVYAVLALGLVSVYRATRVFNFAHAQVAALGAYTGYGVSVTLDLPFWVAALAGALVGAVLGLLIERFLLARMYGRPTLELVVATFAYAMIIRSVIALGWSADVRTIPDPFGNAHATVLGATVRWYGFLLVGVALLLVGGLSVLLARTEVGLALRCCFQDPVAARLVGIRVSAVRTLSWVFGGALAGLAGVLLTPLLYLSPSTMDSILVLAFAAAVVGGMTSFWGAVAGGGIIALVSNLLGKYASLDLKDVYLYALVLLLLCVRPHGLFGDRVDHAESHADRTSTTRQKAFRFLRIARRSPSGSHGTADGRQRHTTISKLLPPIVTLCLLAVALNAPGIFGTANRSSLTAWLINVIAVLGTILVIHYGGRFFLAQNAFMALGGYAVAVLLEGRVDQWVLVLVVATLLTAAAGVVFELMFVRLDGAYYALATLILALLAPLAAIKWTDVTGGELGRAVPFIGTGGVPYTGKQLFLVVALIACALVVTLLVLRSTRPGRAIIAVRDSASGARSLGISPLPRRLVLAGIATGLGGLAGGLSAITSNVVTPHAFSIEYAFMLFVAAVISGSLVWSLVGAAVVTLVPVWFEGTPQVAQAVFGLAILAALFILPARRDALDQFIPFRYQQARYRSVRDGRSDGDDRNETRALART
jgi:branched-chain amino acid transport system permease protein